MNILSTKSTGYALYFKITMVSTSVLLLAIAIKLYVPVILHFVMYQLPSIYAFLVSYLKPPYLYLVINCIIITVVASSKLQNKLDDKSPATDTVMEEDVDVSSELKTVVDEPETVEFSSDSSGLFGYEEENVVKAAIESLLPEVAFINSSATVAETETKGSEVSEIEKGDVALRTPPPAVPVRQDSMELLGSSVKPPMSARFGHRKTLKASPEGGKALRVAKPKRQDTLESTWKAITEGRSMPLTRHLNKSDKWENRHTTEPPPEKTMMKSDTFHERSSLQRAGSGKLKKEPSLSQDDLNRRVEAFINKINQEMKLQRQESLNHYQEMIKRGV